MKKTFAILLSIVLMMCALPPVYAAENTVNFVTDKVTVVVRGEAGAEYANQKVSMLLLKDKTPDTIESEEDIFGIDQTKTDDYGNYEFETGVNSITFGENGVSDGKLYIRVGSMDITNTVVEAYEETEKQFFSDMSITMDENGRIAALSVRAPENFKGDVTLAAAQYDENNCLISVSKPDGTIANGGAEIKVSVEPKDDAAYCRVFGWYKDMKPIQKSDTMQKVPKNILVIGNSFSVDSVKYVHKIAQSMGIELNVHLYQHSGGTVASLYKDREGGTLVQDPEPTKDSYTYAKNQWYYSYNGEAGPNGSSVGKWLDGTTKNPTLDEFLDTVAVDAVVIQNYWAQQEAIAQYDDPGTDAGTDGKNYYPSPHYETMAKYIKTKQPDTQILINSIWSNEDGYYFANYVNQNYAENGFKNQSAFMYDLLEKYNGQSAVDVGKAILEDGSTVGIQGEPVRQLPVGYAIQYARNNNSKFFTTKNSDDFSGWENGKLYPAPEYSGKIRLNRDGYHLSPAGRYIAGCVWVETLTGADVRNASYKPEYTDEFQVETLNTDGSTQNGKAKYYYDAMDSETAKLLRETAHNAVKKFNSQHTRELDTPSLSF